MTLNVRHDFYSAAESLAFSMLLAESEEMSELLIVRQNGNVRYRYALKDIDAKELLTKFGSGDLTFNKKP